MRVFAAALVVCWTGVALAQNMPPPTPAILDPGGVLVLCTAQPTIILENVDDPDGDPVSYFVEVDTDPCFCSPELMLSGALPEGDSDTQWPLPRSFNVDPEAGGHTTFYIRRWASDGVDESDRELSLFRVDPNCLDRDGDGGSALDDDAGVGEDDIKEGFCFNRCSVTGDPGSAMVGLLGTAAVALRLARRRRQVRRAKGMP